MDILLDKEEVYQKLGYLFYAITSMDENTVINEKKKITAVLKKHWSGYHNGVKSTEIIFDNIMLLSSQKLNAEEAYSNFKTYYIRNGVSFSEQLKYKLIEGAEEIAVLFSEEGMDHGLLIRLEKLLFTKTKRISKKR